MKVVYPWSAVVGQDALKHALLLCAIDPAIGGVLVQGPRGVAKTTLARALAELVTGPFVELPLGATEERVTGSLSLDAALRDGRVEFAPGLLARAHDGVLYVDEVNLLPDALVDLILDAAASGWNQVERDGVSHAHPARFVLVGSMNPEEGELRPQLIDRFGLSASAEGTIAPADRAQIVARRLEFDRDPAAFRETYAAQQRELIERCRRARERAAAIALHGPALAYVSERCFEAHVEGVRADLAMLRAARAHAAWHERDEITREDVDAVAELALAHRRLEVGGNPGGGAGGSSGGAAGGGGARSATGGAAGGAGGSSDGAAGGGGARSATGGAAGGAGGSSGGAAGGGGARSRSASGGPADDGRAGRAHDARPHDAAADGERGAIPARPVAAAAAPPLPKWLFDAREGRLARIHAERARTGPRRTQHAQVRRGRPQRAASSGARALGRASQGAIDWFSTLMSARRPRRDQIRFRPRRRPVAKIWILAVDCSSSMLRGGGLAVAKGIAHAIDRHARRTGAHVAVLSFRGAGARLEASSAPGRAVLGRTIADLRGGGGTPLRRALLAAHALCRTTRWRGPEVRKRLLVLTDGRTQESVADLAVPEAGLERIIVDCERGRIRLGRAAQLAAALRAALVSPA